MKKESDNNDLPYQFDVMKIYHDDDKLFLDIDGKKKSFNTVESFELVRNILYVIKNNMLFNK